MRTRAVVSVATLSALLLLLVACRGEAGPTPAPPAPTATAAPAAPAPQPTATTAPAPAAPVGTPAAAGGVLKASEIVAQAAQKLGLPLQLPKPPAVYEPKYGGSLDLYTYGWEFPRRWDWPVFGAYGNGYVTMYAENLLTFPQGPGTNPADYTSQPHLATAWSVSPDGKTFTFTLRKGVKFFSKKVQVDSTKDATAHDWVDITNISFGIDTSRFRARFPEVAGAESWKAVDDYTLQATLKQPTASFLYKLSFRGPQLFGVKGFNERVKKEGIGIEEAMKSGVDAQYGTGPWVMTEWTPEVSISTRRTPSTGERTARATSFHS